MLGALVVARLQGELKLPALKAIARTPEIPRIQGIKVADAPAAPHHQWRGLILKELEGEEFSAYGVSRDNGGLQVLDGSYAGIEKRDLIVAINHTPVKVWANLLEGEKAAAGKSLKLEIIRNQTRKVLMIQNP